MKFSLIAAVALFSACSLAAPKTKTPKTPPTVRIQLDNDSVHKNADKTITADGTSHPISTLWAGTVLDVNGTFEASAALLTSFPKHITCEFSTDDKVILTLTHHHSHRAFDGKGKTAIPVDLTSSTVECKGSR